MSIPHTFAPVRVGSVGPKPTKKVPLKASLETVTGWFPFLLSGREGSAAAGWSKGAQVDDLTSGVTKSKSVMRIVDVIEAINCRCNRVRWIEQYVPWLTDKLNLDNSNLGNLKTSITSKPVRSPRLPESYEVSVRAENFT
ncbi:hypothetical protein EVAR_30346_1 [Eumeta japonica]|uniref:Uncharacterized protein n=1 Tax=Eumeta variegata TaxID=151549 RepID=A0A4C1WAW0_EUMVA|nr:hypothetical protein EVAR_30346_1 [Eumeta japonica]